VTIADESDAGRSACAPDFARINFQGSILQGINIK
jgi:hypothetical protein